MSIVRTDTCKVRLVSAPVFRGQPQTPHHPLRAQPHRPLARPVQIPGIAAPRVTLQPLPAYPKQSGPRGIQVNIGADDLKVARLGLAIYQHRLVAALEQMAKEPVPSIVALRVSPLQPFHTEQVSVLTIDTSGAC